MARTMFMSEINGKWYLIEAEISGTELTVTTTPAVCLTQDVSADCYTGTTPTIMEAS